MANMSYCRFQNTLRDLRDCYYNISSDSLSKEEFEARKQMIEMCVDITAKYYDLLEQEFVEDDWDDDEDE